MTKGHLHNGYMEQKNICKEGSIYMHHSGTPQQSLSCNGFNVSVPTNYGNLNDYESQ